MRKKTKGLGWFGPSGLNDHMKLDWRVCSRARLSRDPRFDGKFFIAVLGNTAPGYKGVYCRPICPAPTAKEKNCRYFLTAAAAAEAGYRPCLRCRPECSPGTPAWLGTPNTVSRALRLIEQDGLEDGGVEALAARLGVGSRHLRRLFLRHLGATPSAVAQTRRLHFAKKLIDETRLPMSQLAIASGFGSVRRFNAAIRRVYHRTPTEIRLLARQKAVQPADQYVFRLRFRPPYDWTGMLAFLAPRATPGVEMVEFGAYSRSISLDRSNQGQYGYLRVSLDERSESLVAEVQFGDPSALFYIVERIRSMFDLNADWASIVASLKGDRALRGRLEAHPGLRVPGCWNGFELAVRAILGQQVSVKAATTFAGRMVEAFGRPFAPAPNIARVFPAPAALAEAPLERIGLTRSRAETIRALARACCEGRLRFEGLLDSDAFLAQLSELPCIGPWTAQYIAMRALREPDAFPSADIGLLRALNLRSPRELERRSQAWRPWRSYAAMYLWSRAENYGSKR